MLKHVTCVNILKATQNYLFSTKVPHQSSSNLVWIWIWVTTEIQSCLMGYSWLFLLNMLLWYLFVSYILPAFLLFSKKINACFFNEDLEIFGSAYNNNMLPTQIFIDEIRDLLPSVSKLWPWLSIGQWR